MNYSAFLSAGASIRVLRLSRHLAIPAVTSLVFLGAACPGFSEEIELNAIAAKVNGKSVTTKEVNFHLAPTKEVLRARFPRQGPAYEKELREAKNAILDRLIENKIVLTELERQGATIPDHVVDGEVRRIITELFKGDESEFRKSLAERGMNMQAFKDSQKEKILIQAFRSQQFADVPPATLNEIKAHYGKRRQDLRDRSKDKISYQKIFIRAEDPDQPGTTPESQLVLAEDLAKQLRDGADFTKLAKEHSDGAFAADGGLWEDEERIDLSPAFAEVIFESEIDTIIGPLKDPAGFTIVKVLKKDLGPFPPLSEVKERMRQEVEIEKRAARYDKWLDGVKRGAMIERRS